MGLRRDGLEIRRWLGSLDGPGDTKSWLETRALSGAWTPPWRRSLGFDDRVSPWSIPLGQQRGVRKGDALPTTLSGRVWTCQAQVLSGTF